MKEQIFKIGGNLYFKGLYSLRNSDENWANPLECPTIFEAYGNGIKSGNWQSCTGINTPDFVISNYLENDYLKYMNPLTKEEKSKFWILAKELESFNNWNNIIELKNLIPKINSLIKKLKTV